MNLLIDCKNFKVSHGQECGLLEIEILEELTYDGQLEHHIDYLNDKYGRDFLNAIKARFDLQEVE